MIATDKKEWKRSIKCSENSKEFQPLSPTEDVIMSLSVSPNYHPNFNNNGRRLRHFSELSSGSDNDNDDSGIVLVGAVSRRTLFDIVKLLNLSYSDYDFSQTKSGSFVIVSYQVINI